MPRDTKQSRALIEALDSKSGGWRHRSPKREAEVLL
jgi:hypothetical protein